MGIGTVIQVFELEKLISDAGVVDLIETGGDLLANSTDPFSVFDR